VRIFRLARLLSACLGISLLLAVQAVLAADPSPDAVVHSVQERYDATQNFAADFKQEMRIEAGGQVIKSSGKVWFQRPGRMRWEYLVPEQQTIVADGTTLWIVQPADNQVLKAPLQHAFESRTPVSFLLGVARIEKDFRATLLSPGDDGRLRLQLDPLQAEDGSLGSLVLDVDRKSYDVVAATIRDPLGNSTRVELHDVQRNVAVDESLFRFERPAGMDVIEAPTQRPS
jgi:outer membrane lipoprotein carrier protein